MKRAIGLVLLFAGSYSCSVQQQQSDLVTGKELEESFRNPPASAMSWVLWDWINGNVTREGITKDLEAMKRVGVSGVVWRGLAGPWWAPEGPAVPYTPEWNGFMQHAIQEAERLGMQFDISIDFGYGSGGPHIAPDISMQKLYWTQTLVDGGQRVDTTIEKPKISMENVDRAWLREGQKLDEKVLHEIRQIDSYRDVAVVALPWSDQSESYTLPQLHLRTGLGDETYFLSLDTVSPPEDAVIPRGSIVDLTDLMGSDGNLSWDVPPGKWRILRFGYASNFKMTRPSPSAAVGLECNRLSPEGIDAHFEAFLEPIFEGAGPRVGKTLKYIFLDSWEAGGQNWTAKLAQEFQDRRGYDLRTWLPVLSGFVVDSPGLTERFLWDFRRTIGEMNFEHYHERLRDLVSPYGVQYSVEGYGNFCFDNVRYAEIADFPISEFWTMGQEKYPDFGKAGKGKQTYYNSMKVMASAAHTTGKTLVGAEAFTGFRGWKDHPFIFKGMGDKAFCLGVNKFILHLSAHQAYDRMKPGLTHRRWGGHFNRHNTWWEYSKPWFDYIARCQHMLQQGRFVADICYFFGEGAPLHVGDMDLGLPYGYDYDICSAQIIEQMSVSDGRIVLPSGMTYRYLVLPDTERLTLSAVQKINQLVRAGAKVIAQKRLVGTPGLVGYPEADARAREIARQLWDKGGIITEKDWQKLFEEEDLQPDFEGTGLNYIHRKTEEADFYFVANPEPAVVETNCFFRISGKIPELWDPETGEIRELPKYAVLEGRLRIPLRFGPMQSWFVVFRRPENAKPSAGDNFPLQYQPLKEINGPWQVNFDSSWGGPKRPVTFERLQDWSKHSVPGIRYYSGTAKYKKAFHMTAQHLSESPVIMLDLGQIEVMARVKVNGRDCGIAWKPPYRVHISDALRAGENTLEIDVVNTWVNRMIGDEHLPEDCDWMDWERLREWPDWFLNNESRPSGRYTFTSAKHYTKDDPLLPSGLLGPVRIEKARARH